MVCTDERVGEYKWCVIGKNIDRPLSDLHKHSETSHSLVNLFYLFKGSISLGRTIQNERLK